MTWQKLMENWPTDLFKLLESAAEDVEGFFQELSEEVNEFFDELAKIPEQITRDFNDGVDLVEELEEGFFLEIDRFFLEVFDPTLAEELNRFDLEDLFDLDRSFDRDSPDPPQPFVTYVRPTQGRHPACVGCNHYHGHVYGGNLLVCGMHPYGWDGESCPDWESEV